MARKFEFGSLLNVSSTVFPLNSCLFFRSYRTLQDDSRLSLVAHDLRTFTHHSNR